MSPDFTYSDLLPLGADKTKYRLVSKEGVSVIKLGDKEFLQVEPSALTLLTETAIHDISHYLRTEHLEQLAKILKDPDASANDRFVALDLLKNANIAAGGILPMCQDTGTALIMGKKGQYVLTTAKDEVALSQGVYDAYTKLNLRYSQMAPVTTWEEKNTGNNLPAQIEIYADSDHQDEYNFMFIAKGGGSANKSFLYQETKAVLNPTSFLNWLDEKLRSIGTAACLRVNFKIFKAMNTSLPRMISATRRILRGDEGSLFNFANAEFLRSSFIRSAISLLRAPMLMILYRGCFALFSIS